MLKRLKKHLIEGFIWGCIFLALNIIGARLFNPENLAEFFENFIPISISLILSVMGFVTTLIVFEIERWHFALKLITHALLALSIQVIIGFSFNLYTTENLAVILTDFLWNIVILLIVWTLYYFEEKHAIKKINKRLLEKSLEQQSDTE